MNSINVFRQVLAVFWQRRNAVKKSKKRLCTTNPARSVLNVSEDS